MEFITDYRTERYILDTGWEDLPEKAKTHVQMCGIDLMTALILGSYGNQFKAGQKLARSMGLTGGIAVVGSDTRYNLLGAAIAMGHSSNSFDIDDGYRMICGHPGTSFVAGTLAAAWERDVSYREYLTALSVCYEVTIRWAIAMQDHYRYLHSTGCYGAFGTAAGVGRLLGLDEKQLNNALSVADFHAPMTPVMRSVEYPSMNKDGVPFGALVGTMAVLETLNGTTGKTHILELPEYRQYLDTLGQVCYGTQLYFKPYTCCRWAHQPIRACQDMMREHGFTHRDVEHVKVNTFQSAARLSKIRPHSTDEAQYNIAFPVASALVHGDVTFAQVREEALDDPDVLDMMDRLEFSVDPEMDRQFPDRRLAWIEVTLKNGARLRSKVYDAPGEPEDPELGLDWIVRKFKRITGPMLGGADQDRLLEMMTQQLDTPVRAVVEQVNAALRHDI